MGARLSQLDDALEQYPKPFGLKSGLEGQFRPLQRRDEKALRVFLQAVPEQERMFIKRRVHDPAVVHEWCAHIDYGHNFALLAVTQRHIIGVATLHQQLGGWKRHIGRVSVLVHPKYRCLGLARAAVQEIIEVARHFGLEKVEAEFAGEQERAIKVFGLIGFAKLACLPNYVKDMEAMTHDYILMGLDLVTDEEYAGVG